jgi:copper(I)-binding protein
MKSAILAPLALSLATLALAGCESRQAPAAEGAPDASPDASQGVSVSDARLVLPAVKGNPGAIYFTVHNDSAADRTIRGVTVKGAGSAMIHQTTKTNGMSEMHEMPQAKVPARGELAFAPGGFHGMALELDDALAKGGATDVTLRFDDGETAVFPAEILAAGDAR